MPKYTEEDKANGITRSMWLEQNGYDEAYYGVHWDTGEVYDKQRVTDATQIDKWRKPNAVQVVPPTDVGEI